MQNPSRKTYPESDEVYKTQITRYSFQMKPKPIHTIQLKSLPEGENRQGVESAKL